MACAEVSGIYKKLLDLKLRNVFCHLELSMANTIVVPRYIVQQETLLPLLLTSMSLKTL